MTSNVRLLLELIRSYVDAHHGHGADPRELILLTYMSSRTLHRAMAELLSAGLILQQSPLRYTITDAGRQALAVRAEAPA